MNKEDEIALWARLRVCALLLGIARVLRFDAREMQKTAREALAAAARLDPGRTA